MKVTVVLPTYNEAQNIEKIIKKILFVFKKSKINGKILVIDDKSPDGTGNIVKKLMKRDKRIRLIEKEKQGLGIALKTGFKKASGDVIVAMDADFSHNPEDIPRLIKELNGADFVIGSRYVKGGKIVGWPLKRFLISKTANFIAGLFLGLGINDVTAGFKAFKKTVLKKVNLKNIGAKGYSFQEELAFNVKKSGFRIKEIPITFTERRKGKSKLGKGESIAFLKTMFKLRVKY